MNTFIYRKDVTKFQINLVLLNFLYIKYKCF